MRVPIALISLSVASLLASGESYGAPTLLGPLDDVTGVTGLQVTLGGSTYTYNVSFVSDQNLSYYQVYASTAPAFLGDQAAATTATRALVQLFETSGVTDVAGAYNIPLGSGTYALNLVVPYEIYAATPLIMGYYGADAGYSNARIPNWQLGESDVALGSDGSFSQAIFTPVPEPLTLALMGLGLVGLGCARRVRRELEPAFRPSSTASPVARGRRREASPGFSEVAHLSIEGALEARAAGAAPNVGRQALVDDDFGKYAQHRRHHEVARREARAVQIELIAQRFAETL
jgi:hypothetical protein